MKYTAIPLPPVELPELRQVGKPLRRVDALGKAVGATVYGADYSMPNMLHAKVFRSSKPSARIKHLDVSKARALSGVVCVLTGEDVPGAKLTTATAADTIASSAALKTSAGALSTSVRYMVKIG